MASARQGRAYTRINFRCSVALRDALQEAADRSGVKLSEQARVSLEQAYNVPQQTVWLPPVLKAEVPKRRTRKKAKHTMSSGSAVA